MFRYLITMVMALLLLPAGVQAASTLHWYAGPNGSLSNGTTTISGATGLTETLTDWQSSRQFTAIPNAGYQFRNYSGTNGFVTRTTNPVRVTDDFKDHDITANFSLISAVVDVVTHGLPAEVADIKAGMSHTVLLRKDGTVVAWGGVDGQSDPAMEKLTGVTAIGTGSFTTFLVKDGTVYGFGKFADDKAVTNLPIFVPSPPLTNVVAVSGGLSHGVALKKDGTVVSWGTSNSYGQISPLPDLQGLKVTAIASGNNFTIALMENGTIKAWGQSVAQAGQNFSALKDVVAISAKAWHALALLKDGTVVGWGYPDNGLPPAGLSNVKAISAGGHHSVALKKDGTLVTWGDNSRGQRNVPAGLNGWVTGIGTGYYHTLALTDGAVVGWGNNLSNQCYAPMRAYRPVTNGTMTCQTRPFSTTVDFGSDSVCSIEPNSGLKTFFAVNGVPRTVADGSTTTTLTNIQTFQTVSAAFGMPPDPPSLGAVTVANGQATVQIIPPANNGGSPILGYTVTTKTPSVGLGVDTDAGTTKLTHTITGLTSGTEYSFTATARNVIGTSAASAPSTRGSVSINNGAAYTKSATVTLTFAANVSNGGVTQLCVSNGASCTAWGPFTTTRTWTLAAGDGPKTVNAWLKDGLGNVNSTPYAASITLDATPPVNGTLSLTPDVGAFTLNWQGFSDAATAVASYKLVRGTISYPACSGTPLYSGTATSYVDSDIVNGTTYYYRVCAVDSAGNTSTGATVMKKALAEYDAPTGSVAIIGGSNYTKSALVSLALTANDASGVAQVCISNGATCTVWTPYATAKPWTLLPGDGPKTVKVWYKDTLGNVSAEPVSATVTLDATAPTNGTLTITPAPGSFTLNWQGATDAGSGIALYRLVMGTLTYPTCAATPLYTGTDTSYVHNGVTTGTTYYYRLCTVDGAGNTSLGATAMKKALAEYDPPAGSVAINTGAQYTKSPLVTLALAATDASGVSQVCVSNTATCVAWAPYATTKPWTLAPGNGLKTVNVWFKDSLGNVNSQPYPATITLDATPPVNGTLTIAPAVGAFTLNWQGFSDTASGIASYRLVKSSTTYPACTGTPLYSGTLQSFVDNEVVAGTTYFYRLCAVDNAGNTSVGAIAMKKALAEYDAPTGSVTINNSAAFTRTPTVSLALAATDASGVSQVCVSNSATCTLWTPYVTTKPWTLAPGDGVKTVNVWFKDSLGNVNAQPYSATITLDATPPTSGALAIVPEKGTFTLNWQGATDGGSGIASYKLAMSTMTYPACSATPLYTGNATSFVHDGVVTGTTYYYRLCTLDNAGNTSIGATATKRALDLAEYDPPAGSITINNGASYTKTLAVNLALSATDASGVSQICISNSAICTVWTPYLTSRVWTLPAGDGLKTVNVWFKDSLGNQNAWPYSASIYLDTAPPTGAIAINDGAVSTTTSVVTLAVSATDKGGTVASMQFSNDGLAWSAWEVFAASKEWTLSTGTGIKRVFARFMDTAGNISLPTSDTITVTAP